jgi:predicted DNA-binding protein (MmcQ/YjbR family)
MWKNPAPLINKRPIFSKLPEYGFTRCGQLYRYCTDIAEGMFSLTVQVSENTAPEILILDKTLNEEYSLAYAPSATGAFVGAIHAELQSILTDIADKCFEADIFKSKQAKEVIAYIRNTYGIEAEYLWEKFPDNAIFRDHHSRKWFAALLTVEKQKIGLQEEGSIEILDLKAKPEKVALLVDGVTFLPGYHMNKKHWFTIRLDDSVASDIVATLIDESFKTIQKNSR